MKNANRTPVAALAIAGGLWGLTVPLSKVTLEWLGPGWLTVARFAIAAPLLALVARRDIRRAMTLRILAAGAVGFGAVMVLQNAGIAATSITHAAVIVGVTPVLIALIGLSKGNARLGPRSWAGYGLALGGVALVANSVSSGATRSGDLLVLGSAGLSAVFITVQPKLLKDQNPAAVTAVQFLAGAIISIPVAVLDGPLPLTPASPTPVLALGALCALGTLLPFWLFAWGQARVSAHVAGAFVNLEPVVGAALGWLAFGNTAGVGQIVGAVAVLAGIATIALPSTRAIEKVTPDAPERPPLPDALTRLDPLGEWGRSHRPTLELPTIVSSA